MENNNMINYNQFWLDASKTTNWRDYILPKRTIDEFNNEGLLQANNLKKYYEENDVVLEFGCGIGRVIKQINVKDSNKIGVDVCQKFLDEIKIPIKKIKTDGIKINGVLNESVDFIYSLMVFQHINKNDHISLLKQLYGFLKPEGTMLIQFPKKENSKYYRQGKFVNIYSYDEIKSYCDSIDIANFKIEEGNLIGYGDGLINVNTENREYFLEIKKI